MDGGRMQESAAWKVVFECGTWNVITKQFPDELTAVNYFGKKRLWPLCRILVGPNGQIIDERGFNCFALKTLRHTLCSSHVRMKHANEIFNIQLMPTFKMCKIEKGTCGRAKKDPQTGDYKWLLRANSEEDRAARREIKDKTEFAVASRGFSIGTAKVSFQHVDSMIDGTRLISPSKGHWPSEDPSASGKLDGSPSCKIIVETGVVLDVATRESSSGKCVVAVNAASGYHSGGGFGTGGRHALEESMCTQSTLYPSLQKATTIAEQAKLVAPEWARPAQNRFGTEWMMHIPDDGVVLSPSVEVFRGGTLQGYPFQETAVALEAVISVAMPNCNDRMSDLPVDAHPDAEEYRAQLKRKWRAVLTAAAQCTSADTLVIPDAGCGVFRNPPSEVGAALGQVLREEFTQRFSEIFIVFPGGANGEEFAEHALAVFEGKSPRLVGMEDNTIESA